MAFIQDFFLKDNLEWRFRSFLTVYEAIIVGLWGIHEVACRSAAK